MHYLKVMLLPPLPHAVVPIKHRTAILLVKLLQSLWTYKQQLLIYMQMMQLCQAMQNVLLLMVLVQVVQFPYYKVQPVIQLTINHIYKLLGLLLHLQMYTPLLLMLQLPILMQQIWLMNGAITVLHHLIK